MPHFPKPFFRPSRGLWYVQLHRKQINLGSDRETAFRQYGELISRPAPPKLPGETVAVLLDIFCRLVQVAPRGANIRYQIRCQSFLGLIPATPPIHQLKPFHVQQWVDGKGWNGGMKHRAMIAIQRGFNWLAKQGLHVATLLTLHELFDGIKGSPVPQFLVIDPPSQIYFPERWPGDPDTKRKKPGNAAGAISEDIKGVRRIFRALAEVSNEQRGDSRF